MLHEDPGNVSYSAVGGLSDQIRELRESIELPLMNPELFLRVGIKPPKVLSLYRFDVITKLRFFCLLTLFVHFSLKGCASLWSSWYWQDIVGQSNCE